MNEKKITIKIPERHLKWIKNKTSSIRNEYDRQGTNSLFEYGGIDIQEVHATADLLYHLNEAFKIEEGE